MNFYKTKQRVLAVSDNNFTFYFLAAGILLSAAFYMYFINTAVRNAVSVNDTESQILAIQNKVSDLEYSYMIKMNAITPELAKPLGLVEPKSKIFISRSLVAKALSFNK